MAICNPSLSAQTSAPITEAKPIDSGGDHPKYKVWGTLRRTSIRFLPQRIQGVHLSSRYFLITNLMSKLKLKLKIKNDKTFFTLVPNLIPNFDFFFKQRRTLFIFHKDETKFKRTNGTTTSQRRVSISTSIQEVVSYISIHIPNQYGLNQIVITNVPKFVTSLEQDSRPFLRRYTFAWNRCNMQGIRSSIFVLT